MKVFGMSLALLASANAFSFNPYNPGSSMPSMPNSLGGKSPGYTSKTSGWELNRISPNVRIEGDTRHTWSFTDSSKENVQLSLHSQGRPIDANIELWIGPDWTPVTIKAHSEDGKDYPIQTVVGTRNKNANLQVRNIGPYTMPMTAAASYAISPLAEKRNGVAQEVPGRYIEGGAVYHHSFPAEIDQCQVLLKTKGKQLNAKIELLNGPNNIKQEFEVFTNNGELNSLFVVFDTPGDGNALRVKNLAPVEFPCECFFQPSKMRQASAAGLDWN